MGNGTMLTSAFLAFLSVPPDDTDSMMETTVGSGMTDESLNAATDALSLTDPTQPPPANSANK